MTHSPALTSARDALDYFRSLNVIGSKDYGTAAKALAAIDAELAASADAGRLAEELKTLIADVTGITGGSIQSKVNQLAVFARPAPAEEPMEMALCEIERVVLRPGQFYRFTQVGDCEDCAKMQRWAEETYGEVGIDVSQPPARRETAHVLTTAPAVVSHETQSVSDNAACFPSVNDNAAPVSAQGDERKAFEAYIRKDGGDLTTFGTGKNVHYCNRAVENAWDGWQARAQQGGQG